MCKSVARVLFATVSVVFVCCVCWCIAFRTSGALVTRARARQSSTAPPALLPSLVTVTAACGCRTLFDYVCVVWCVVVCVSRGVSSRRGALVIGRRTDFYRQWRWVDRNGYNRERLMRPMNHLPLRQTYHPPLHHSYSADAVCCAIITEHFVRSHSHDQPTVRALPAECSKPLAVPQI